MTPSNPASGTNEAAVQLREWLDRYADEWPATAKAAHLTLTEALATERAIGAEACTASEPHGECRFGNGPAKGKYSGWRCYRAERAIGAARPCVCPMCEHHTTARLASETPRPGEPTDATDA